MIQREKEELGIYIHIPFCKKKCFYCDFISFDDKCEKIELYIKALKQEIQIWIDKNKFKYNISTIYIGGGTPSYIESKYIGEILEGLKEIIKQETEITIEVNPGTVTEEKLRDYKKFGINRISIGLQSTNNKLLKQIGRIHTFKEFLNTYELARKVGIENINVDLMLGLPNQTIQHLKESLNQIISLKPEHISIYSLIVEENTKISELIESKILKLPEEETERNMYWYVKNILELNGYKHYEISNFAKEGYESKHNLSCWEQEQYVGFGIAAHSYIEKMRYSNVENINDYIKNITENKLEKNKIIHEKQELQDEQKEYMILGLRKIEGVSINKYKNKFGQNPIYQFRKELNKLVNEDLIQVDQDKIKLTNKGLDLANQVWEEFV